MIFLSLITVVTFVDVPWLSNYLDLVSLERIFAMEAYFIQVGFGIMMIIVGNFSWHYAYKG
jgi:hypothetical protein